MDGQPELSASAPDPEVLRTLGMGPERRPRLRKALIGLLVLLVLSVSLYGGRLVWLRREAARKPEYLFGEYKRRTIEIRVFSSGTLRGLGTVEVGTEVSGRVSSVLVGPNDPVRIGQVLAEIDPEQSIAQAQEATAQVASADAQVEQARANLSEAERTLTRAREQSTAGILSRAELDRAEAELARAKAQVRSAEAGAALARATYVQASSRLKKTKVMSPMDGVVLSRSVEPGQTVAAGFQTPVLFKLTEDLRKMELIVLVDEADIGRVNVGQKANFTVPAYADRQFPSEVVAVRFEPKTEQNVVSYEAVLSVDNRELLLRPGMTASASIQTSVAHDQWTVPSAALRYAPSASLPRRSRFGPPEAAESPGPQVFRLEDGVPKATPVTPGPSDGEFTVIVSPSFRPSEKVILDESTPAP